MHEYIQVLTTVNDEKKAGETARLLLRKRKTTKVEVAPGMEPAYEAYRSVLLKELDKA